MSLKPEQYEAIQLLTLPKKERPTLQQIAEKCGVHPNTLANWRKDLRFQAELKQEVTRRTQDRLPELMDALIDHGIGGNAAAAKLILQANGMLTDKVEVDVKETKGIDVTALQERLARVRAAEGAGA